MSIPSPLTEASPTSLQELFDKDPLSLTDDDVERIVGELRAQRDRWEKASPKQKSKLEAVTDISVEDLGI